MGSEILPGVKLGDHTVVGAGSIVTKSFPEGHCVLAGNPAVIVKGIDSEKCSDRKMNKSILDIFLKINLSRIGRRN
jgi:acetyltransferase-like isoleucine patch superfamily enzyme